MKKAFALGRQAPVAADTDTATSVGVCLDQEKVPIDAYWLTWEDELLKDAGPIWLPFTLRISTNDMVITLPLPTGGISVGKAETCDVRVRAEALVPRLLKIVPEGHRQALARRRDGPRRNAHRASVKTLLNQDWHRAAVSTNRPVRAPARWLRTRLIAWDLAVVPSAEGGTHAVPCRAAPRGTDAMAV